MALTGLIAGLVGIALALSYPYWTPMVYGGSEDKGDRVTAAQVRSTLSPQIAELKAQVAALTAQNADLQQTISVAKVPGILMVAGELVEALNTDQPYSSDLILFRSIAGENDQTRPILAEIQGGAENGVPTFDQINATFDEVAQAVMTAQQKVSANGALAQQVSETMASITAATMRLRWKIDGIPTGDGLPAMVARAEQAVDARDYSTAIDELVKLPAEFKASADGWIASVRARMAIQAAQQNLQAYMITLAARVE